MTLDNWDFIHNDNKDSLFTPLPLGLSTSSEGLRVYPYHPDPKLVPSLLRLWNRGLTTQ